MKEDSANTKKRSRAAREEFIEDVDFYYENGLMILTAHFLLKRGFCCGSGCRHCPYPKHASE